MSAARMIELAVAVVLLGAGVYFYRRPKGHDNAGDNYGSQGAVIMFVVAAIMGIHALGGLDYHPSAAQADLIRDRSQ